jgi:hypothetical protein
MQRASRWGNPATLGAFRAEGHPRFARKDQLCGLVAFDIIFLVLFIADQETKVGADSLPSMKVAPQLSLEAADPSLKLVSGRSPYMRTER